MSGTTANPAVRKTVFSSATDDWPTPQALYDALDAEFGFALDPCSSVANHKAPLFYAKDHPDPARQNGLEGDWAADALAAAGAVFMNPPYGRGIGPWMAKAAATARAGATVVCLVPARTDTAWFHDHVVAEGAEVRFIRGRVKFGAATTGAPFASLLVIYRVTSPEPVGVRPQPRPDGDLELREGDQVRPGAAGEQVLHGAAGQLSVPADRRQRPRRKLAAQRQRHRAGVRRRDRGAGTQPAIRKRADDVVGRDALDAPAAGHGPDARRPDGHAHAPTRTSRGQVRRTTCACPLKTAPCSSSNKCSSEHGEVVEWSPQPMTLSADRPR